MDDMFGDMFDLDNDGEIDDIEKTVEIGFMSEDFTEEDDEDYDYNFDNEDDEY